MEPQTFESPSQPSSRQFGFPRIVAVVFLKKKVTGRVTIICTEESDEQR